MRRSLAIIALVTALAAPTNEALAFSKTAQKAVFAAGLLAVGGVVRALIRRDRDRTTERVRELRAKWGEPANVATVQDGFDTLRVETYSRHERWAWATFRNDRLLHVRYDDARPDSGDGSDADDP
jgi:hypothetical protein